MTPAKSHSHDRLSQLERAAGVVTPQICVAGLMFYAGIADRRPELDRNIPPPESNEMEDLPPKVEP